MGFDVLALLLISSILTMGVAALPILLRKNYFLFELPTFFLGSVFIGIFAKILYIFVYIGQSETVDYRLLLDSEIYVLFEGLTICLTALISFSIGYLVNIKPSTPINRKIQVSVEIWNDRRVLLASVVILSVTVASFASYVIFTDASFDLNKISQKRFLAAEGTKTRLENAYYYLYKVATLAKLVFYLLLAYLITSERKSSLSFRILVLCSFLIGIFVPFYFGNRAGIMLIVLDAIVISYFLGYRINKTLVILLGFISLMLFTLTSNLRETHFDEKSFFDHVLGGRYFLDITKLSHIVSAVPEKIDYLYGETLVGWLFAPLPHAIWPGKPMFMELSGLLATDVFNEPTNAIPAGIIGELFINMGWFGVVIGMFMIGLVARYLFSIYLHNASRVIYSVLFGMIVARLGIFLLNNDLGTTILKIGIDIIPLYLLFLICRKRYFILR